MLVCPQCRRENLEEATACANCGRSLAPEEGAPVRSERRDALADEINLATPKRPSSLPAIIVLAVIALGLGGYATYLALRPNPCEGKFSSENNPYCLTLPAGWDQAAQSLGDSKGDQFFPQEDAQSAVVVVMAEEAPGGTDAGAYAKKLRVSQEEQGGFPGPAQAIEVGGVEGVAWENNKFTQENGALFRQRVLAVVHGGRAWVIQFVVRDDSYQQARLAFEDMLDSWVWR